MSRSTRILMNAIDRECSKQQVDDAARWRLFTAHVWMSTNILDTISVSDIQHLAEMIEPRNAKGYRKIPVTFASGGTANHPDTIEAGMNQVVGALNQHHDYPAQEDSLIIKAFLEVHAFEDGNGRLAWLLYNWLMYDLQATTALPYFFGEDKNA